MSIEVRPLGVRCNLQCLYCYQHLQRYAKNIPDSYNMEKIKACLEKVGKRFTLFGGEPLLVPEKDIEELWSWALEKFGGSGIQTNGVLINENHIRMFKKYNVNVGISVDGPGKLNDARWNGTLEKTREATAKTHEAIERLLKEKICLSLIITLHRGNATIDKLPMMHNWLMHLDDIGVKCMRLHTLEVENNQIRERLRLTDDEYVEAFESFHTLSNRLNTLKIDLFSEMFNMLLGQDKNVTCIWTACDQFTTRAVQGFEGNGQSSNCSRTNKDGIDFVKCSVQGFERYFALYHTPHEYSGCQGCRFFLMCKGHCPGSAIDGDWRNRTEQCGLWKRLFTHLEQQMLDRGQIPLSQSPDRQAIEMGIVNGWAMGFNLYIADILNEIKQRDNSEVSTEHVVAKYVERTASKGGERGDPLHGDHSDHGDSNHDDSDHGDHTDHGDGFN